MLLKAHYIRPSLKLLLTLTFTVTSSFQATAGSFSTIGGSKKAITDDALRRQEIFQKAQILTLQELIDAGANNLLLIDGKRPLPLTELKKAAKKIQYIPQQFLYTADSSLRTNALDAQWLTAMDSPTKEPMVSTTKFNQDFSEIDLRLITHESFSALGIVDDEYQVTAPLFAILDEARLSGQTVDQLLSRDQNIRDLADSLKSVQTRKSTPRYRIDGASDARSGGGTTGIGGGGDGQALAFKSSLILNARAWWNENGKSDKNFKLFYKRVLALGIEPFDYSRNTGVIFPIEIEFKKSIRTKKLTAYFRIKKIADFGHSAAAQNHIYHYIHDRL